MCAYMPPGLLTPSVPGTRRQEPLLWKVCGVLALETGMGSGAYHHAQLHISMIIRLNCRTDVLGAPHPALSITKMPGRCAATLVESARFAWAHSFFNTFWLGFQAHTPPTHAVEDHRPHDLTLLLADRFRTMVCSYRQLEVPFGKLCSAMCT